MYALTVLWQCYEYEEVEEKEWRSNSEQESGAAGEEKKRQRRLYYNNHSGTGNKQNRQTFNNRLYKQLIQLRRSLSN